MRKDFILTREAKDLRQQCIEENRRLRSTPITNSNLTTTSSALPCLLTEADQACLADLQRVHLLSRQSSPSASSIFSFELLPDPESAFIHTMNLENLYALQMINFLRSVSDFASLDERDRLTLVKYNLNSLFYVQASLTYDPTNGICYFEHVSETPSSSETAFAHQCERLYSLCYGDAALQRFTSVIHALHEILACDSTSAQLLMLMMIFLKGWSLDEDQAPILIDGKRVFQAQSKYTDLFFRYLLSKFPVETAAMKMTRVLDQMLKMQSISQDYDPYIKSKAQTAHINPLMKSLLHLS